MRRLLRGLGKAASRVARRAASRGASGAAALQGDLTWAVIRALALAPVLGRMHTVGAQVSPSFRLALESLVVHIVYRFPACGQKDTRMFSIA